MRRIEPRQRSELRPGKHRYTAGMALRYHVPLTPALYQFFDQLGTAWRDIVGLEELRGKRGMATERDRFRLHDAPQYMEPAKALGMTAAELRLSGAEARRHRVRWATSDSGETRTRILDKLARLRRDMSLPTGALTMRLSQAVPLAQHTGRSGERKFGLVPRARDRVARYLVDAHDLVIDELGSRIPLETRDRPSERTERLWLPHLTVGHVFRGVPHEEVDACAAALDGLVKGTSLNVRLTEETLYDYRIQRQSYRPAA